MEKHSTMVDLGRRAIDSVDAQRYPAQCLIVAAVAGFCVARVIRK